MSSGPKPPARWRALPAVLLLSAAVLATGASTASAATYRLMVSKSSARSSPVSLDGTTQSGNVYVFATTDSPVSSVEFFVDGVSKRVERIAPYDLAGTGSGDVAQPFDTHSLPDGAHRVTPRVTPSSGAAVDLNAAVTIQNTPPSAPASTPSYPPRIYGLNSVTGWGGWDDAKAMGAKVLRHEFIYTSNPTGYDDQFTAAAQRGQMLL